MHSTETFRTYNDTYIDTSLYYRRQVRGRGGVLLSVAVLSAALLPGGDFLSAHQLGLPAQTASLLLCAGKQHVFLLPASLDALHRRAPRASPSTAYGERGVRPS